MDDFNSLPGQLPNSPTTSQVLRLWDDMVTPDDPCIAAIEGILEWDPFADEVLGANPQKSDATDLKVHGDVLDVANDSALPSCMKRRNKLEVAVVKVSSAMIIMIGKLNYTHVYSCRFQQIVIRVTAQTNNSLLWYDLSSIYTTQSDAVSYDLKKLIVFKLIINHKIYI